MPKTNIAILLLILCLVGAPSLLPEDRNGPVVIISGDSQNVFRLKAFGDSFEAQLDPIHSESAVFLSVQLYDSLVSLDENLNPTPALAEYWYKDYSGLRHTFDLRRGVRFHHGEEMTADDVKFSLERILDPRNGSPYASYFLDRVIGAREYYSGLATEVTGFQALDRYTFVIRWKKPYAMALSLLSMPFCKILPKQRLMDQGRRFFQKPSGTGPFRFEEWVRDTRLDIVGVRLARYPEYFQGTPNLEFVEFCPYFRLEDFLEGKVHAIPVVSEQLLQSEYQILRDGSIFPFFLGMSCHLAPLDDPLVRRAVSLGINKPEIVRATHDVRFHRQLLHSFIPDKLPGYFLTDEINTYNPIQAQELLAEAGLTPDMPLPELTLFMEHPRTDFKHSLYRELKQQLEALGIELEERYYRRLNQVLNSRRPYLILSSKRLDFPGPEDIIRSLFASNSAENLCRYRNPDLDRLLGEAELEKSWNVRNKLFVRIQQILNTEMPAVPLFTQQNLVAVQPFVHGIQNPPLGFYHIKMKNIRFER
jgi:ABC-type transport system substrate-binding protein